MNTSTTESPKQGWNFRTIVAGLVLAAVLGGSAAPALADEHDRDRHDQHDRARDHRDRGWDHRRYVEPRPRVVYAPPPVVYEPPPPPAALNFVFPLNFR